MGMRWVKDDMDDYVNLDQMIQVFICFDDGDFDVYARCNSGERYCLGAFESCEEAKEYMTNMMEAAK